jgi:CRISPR-associated exonuclease Cas4
MIAIILVSLAVLLIAWLMRRQGQRQIGPSLSGRILYTDTEAHREILTSDRYNLSGSPDYILEEHGELIPVERKSRAVNSRGAYDSERLQLAAYCLLVEERYGNPCVAVGCSIKTARWMSPSTARYAPHFSRS